MIIIYALKVNLEKIVHLIVNVINGPQVILAVNQKEDAQIANLDNMGKIVNLDVIQIVNLIYVAQLNKVILKNQI